MARRRLPRNTSDALDPTILLRGEIAYDETGDRLRVGDGRSPGGASLPRLGEAGFPSLAAARVARIPESQDVVRVDGFAAPGDGGGALYKRAVSEPAHPGKFQSEDGRWWELAETVVFPEMFGATGGADDTLAIQAMADAAPLLNARCEGRPGRVYNVSLVRWLSGSRVKGLDLKTVPTATATLTCPFLIDGRQAPVSDVIMEACSVDGNRVNQLAMDVTPADGARFGFWIAGRASNIKLIRPKAWYCGTEGLFLFGAENEFLGGLTPANATDYLLRDIRIVDPDLQWNGRHGGSGESAKGVTISGGVIKNNGEDMPGFPSTDYGCGGNARRFGGAGGMAGVKYGWGWDWESYGVGTGYEDITMSGIDMSDNAGGSLLFYHRLEPGYAPIKNIAVKNCRLTDNSTVVGEGSVVLAPMLPNGGLYNGNDIIFDGVVLSENHYNGTGIAIRNADNVSVTGGRAIVRAPAFAFAGVVRCGPAVVITVPSSGRIAYGTGPAPAYDISLPFAFDALTQIMGSTGSIVVDDLGGRTFIAFTADGGYTVQRRYVITTQSPGDAHLGWTFTVSNGFAPTDIKLTAYIPDLGFPVLSSGASSERDVQFMVATGSVSGRTIVVQLEMTCRRVA